MSKNSIAATRAAATLGLSVTDAIVLAGPIVFDGCVIQVERITPARAEAILCANDYNRRVREASVAKWAEAMTLGDWVFNGDAIRIDRNGNLRDGQHRLRSCITSGESFVALVVYGLDPRSQDTMDIGDKRTVSDALAMAGYRSTATLGGGLALLSAWIEHGVLTRANSRGALTPKQALRLLELHPGLVEHSTPITALRRIASPSMWCVVSYLLHRANPTRASMFLAGVASGIDLGPGDPRLALRARLTATTGKGLSLDTTAQAWMTLRAWVAYERGTPMRRIQLPDSLWSATAWPDIPGDELRFSGREDRP